MVTMKEMLKAMWKEYRTIINGMTMRQRLFGFLSSMVALFIGFFIGKYL